MTTFGTAPWATRLGHQRHWNWRGWNIRYTYQRCAANPEALPILLIHGFGSSLTQWHANVAPLSQVHPVYAIDMLGFGFSEKAPANYNTQLWREQIYEFWRTVIGRPVLLVGHSLGALTALAIAATHPDMVEKLVLMTLPATRQELLPPWAQPAVSALEGLFANALVVRSLFHLARQPAVIRAALKTAYTNAALVTDELVQSYVAPTAQRGAARTLCRLSKAATRADYTPNPDRLLTQLHCPVLLLWGEGDRIIPFARAQQLVKSHANLHLISFPKAGHCIYEECADQVNQTILNWQLSTMT